MAFVQSMYNELKHLKKIQDEGLILEEHYNWAYEAIIRQFTSEGKNIRDFSTDGRPVSSSTGPAVETSCTRTPDNGKRTNDSINDGGTVDKNDNRHKIAKTRQTTKDLAEQVRKR